MKKSKKIMATALASLMLGTSILGLSVSASEMAYNSYKVSGTVSKETPALKNNSKNDAYFWVWAAPPSGRDKIVHRSILHNSDEENRSDELLTYEGTTHQAATTTRKYYDYHMNVRRHYDHDDYATISGTWGWIY